MKSPVCSQPVLVHLSKLETKPKEYHGFELKMIQGFHFDECASALQKTIRRGLEFEAVYWAGVFYRSGYSRYLAKRLKTIMEEDVGQGNVTCLVLANQIYTETQAKSYETEQSSDGFLKYVNLIVLACRSKKTRIADELGNIVLDLIDKLDVRLTLDNDYLDPHTRVGKIQHGRWDDNEHKAKALARLHNWFTNWSYLADEDQAYNQYRDINKAIWKLPHLSESDKKQLLVSIENLICAQRTRAHAQVINSARKEVNNNGNIQSKD